MGGGQPPRLLTFRSGGWILVLAGLFSTALIAWALAGAFVRHDSPLRGDGRNVETYGFPLEPCLVDRDLVVAGGLRKDALPALVDPAVISAAEAAGSGAYDRYLVGDDRVIGVLVGDDARAYPLMIMKVHEIANDVLAGIPIAVTYNPLCDSAIVFDRTVAGEVVEFGVSGLLYNSNLLMFDRRPDPAAESLWSQLQARAVIGPAAGQALATINAELTTWADWRHGHPGTTVLRRDPKLKRRYKETRYESYFQSSAIMFPVRPAPPPPPPDPKQRIVAVTAGDARGVFPLDAIARRVGPDGIWRTTLGKARLEFHYRPGGDTVTVEGEPGGPPVTAFYAMWFAWHAMHPGDPLVIVGNQES